MIVSTVRVRFEKPMRLLCLAPVAGTLPATVGMMAPVAGSVARLRFSLYDDHAVSILPWDRFSPAPTDSLPVAVGPAAPGDRGRRRRRTLAAALLMLTGAASACDPGLGVDPAWASLALPDSGYVAVDSVADVGAELFRRNCAGCHAYGDAVIGPDMTGVTHRRSQTWIRGMVANPDSMLRVDSLAQRLLVEYQIPMLNRELDAARVRAILEFLWRADHAPGAGQSPSPAGDRADRSRG